MGDEIGTEARTSRPLLAGACVLAFVYGAGYWLLSALIRPDEPFSVTMSYRFGDNDHFPILFNLARFRFGEFVWAEGAGSGLVVFPVVQMLPHALAYSALGRAGIMLVDGLFGLAYFGVLYRLVRLAFRHPAWSCLIAFGLLVFLTQDAELYDMHVPALAGTTELLFPLQLRMPRPYLGAVWLMVCVLLLVRIAGSGGARAAPFAWLGLASAVLIQGDAHGGRVMLLSSGMVGAWLLVRTADRWALARRVALGAGSLAVGLTPFVAQLMAGADDQRARLGVFPVSRADPLVLVDDRAWVVIPVVGLFLFGVWLVDRRRAEPRAPGARRAVVVVYLTYCCCAAAPTVSSVLLGRGIQVYHFLDRSVLIGWILLVLLVLYGVRLLGAGVSSRSPLPRTVAALLIVMTLVGTFGQSYGRVTQERQDRPWGEHWPVIPVYRGDFTGLVRELEDPRYARARVVGTFDHDVAMWWITFGGGHMYVPDPWLSNAPTRLIDERIVDQSRLLGLDEAQFMKVITNPSVVNQTWTHALYQASSSYSFASLDDYTVEQQSRIRSSQRYETWQLFVPRSELARMRKLFAERTIPRAPPDLLILDRANQLAPYRPIDRYVRTWSNGTFEVWVRR